MNRLTDILPLLFPAAFLAVALWEARRPARAAMAPMTLRWFGNISVFGLGWLIAWLLPFLTQTGAAVIAARHGWGLLNIVAVPAPVALIASLVALDFLGYWSHRLFHFLPPLWRLHALHHSDSDLDVTTTIRHHPLELLAQMLFDAAAAILLGLPPQAVIVYGGVVLLVETFNHGNMLLPRPLRWLSRWLMTPDLHRLHHSVRYAENNSNFGNLIPLWDRLFGTLRLEPEGALRIGLPEITGDRAHRLDQLLLQPLRIRGAAASPGPGAAEAV